MSLEILFLRHGKAARPVDIDDFDRPLTTRGKRQAQKIGAWLQTNNLRPDAVLSSPARRACDTAAKVIKAAGLNAGLIRTDPSLYFDSTRNLLAALAGMDGMGERLLVVGHNPWMEELVLSLAQDRPRHPGGNWYMKTGALMHFSISDLRAGLEPGRGRLLAHVLPGELPDLLP
jgi:phosphohistidine phosphatase